jgi:hypothetical protein
MMRARVALALLVMGLALAASIVAGCGGGGGADDSTADDINAQMELYIRNRRGAQPILDVKTDFVCHEIEKVFLGTPAAVPDLSPLRPDVAKQYLDTFCQPYAEITPGPSPTLRAPVGQ